MKREYETDDWYITREQVVVNDSADVVFVIYNPQDTEIDNTSSFEESYDLLWLYKKGERPLSYARKRIT